MHRMYARGVALVILISLAIAAHVLVPGQARAYVYPEHRRITVIGIKGLESTRRAQLAQLWSLARSGYEARLFPSPVDSGYAPTSTMIDLAAWPAIGGDHSCSASDMLHTILSADWIIGVHDVGASLEERLFMAGDEKFKRTNALRDADLRLLTVDPEYATRAGANNVHFLLPRPAPATDLRAYIGACITPGAPLNAVSTYVRHHVRAMMQAQILASGAVADADRPALARAILANEAFALHFLEDMFAAGHVAGSWGDAALRKGTHDYYNEHGVAVTTWNGESFVIMGDAWMRDEDGQRAGRVIRMSLEQLLDVATGMGQDVPRVADTAIPSGTDTLNVCKNDYVPDAPMMDRFLPVIARVIGNTPVPGLDAGAGELPRFRAELGPFLGISAAVRTAWHRGGFLKEQQGSGFTTAIEVAGRVGLGLDGVMNESGDGLVYLDIGWSRDAASSLKINSGPGIEEFGAITAAIPSRSAFFARLRMPFWILPFDLLVAGPVLAFTSPETFVKMGIAATNGGLVGWQSGIATSFGRFQFILGREVTVALYGRERDGNRVLSYRNDGAGEVLHLLEIRSIQLTFPIIDYRNFRTFSRDQSSGMHIQVFGGVDIPDRIGVIIPAGTEPGPYGSIWFIGARISLDWRYYF